MSFSSARIDSLVSRAAGKLKRAGAVLRGDIGIFAALEEDHAVVSMLMERLLSTEDDDSVGRRARLFELIKIELLAHAQAEEAELYALLAEYPLSTGQAEASVGEHREIEMLIDRLDGMGETAPEFLSTFRELQRAVEHHVQHEESELFERARQLLDERALKEIESRFHRSKRLAKKVLEDRSDRIGGQPEDVPPVPLQ